MAQELAQAPARPLSPRLLRAPRRLAHSRSFDRSLGTISLLGGLLLWEVAGWLFELAWLPPFSQVIADLAELIGEGVILGNLFDSLRGLALGFLISLVVGLTVGALMGRYRRVDQALDVYVYAFFVAPSMIFVPIFFAIFGLSGATRIAVIFMYSVFVIIINTATAVRVVDPSLIEMARSFGASRDLRLFREVLLPASLPLVLAGVRLGMGRAVKGMINGEMFIALIGLGALAQRFGGRFESSRSFAIALVILVVALVANRVVQLVDRRFTSWCD